MNSIIKSSFIRKRGDNYNIYIEYIDDSGKLKQKSIGKYQSKKDADKHLIDLKSSLNNNNYILSKNVTLVNRYKEYIYDKTRNLSPGTLKYRESDLKTNIEPFFKDTKLDDITPYLLQSYTNYLYSKYTKGSANCRLASIKAVLREAYRLKEISENPVLFIKTPSKSAKADNEINEPYNKDEIKYILSNLEGKTLELPIILMLGLGLRFAEVGGLRWQDIDFKNNTVSINQNLIYTENTGIIFKSPKTQGSIRTISVPSEIMTKLKKYRVKHNEYKLSNMLDYPEIVCLNTVLKPFTEQALCNMWHRFLKKINARRIRLHDLRHTHATMLVLSGTDFKTISERLGHTDIKITLNRYSHVLKEMDRKASDNISNIIFG